MRDIESAYTVEKKGGEPKFVTFNNLEDTAKQLREGWMVLWQHHAVHLGEITNDGEVKWVNDGHVVKVNIKDHFIRLRAFNTDKEYHLWKTGDDIKGRVIEDISDGNGAPCIDTNMVLRGVITDQYFLRKPEVKTKDSEKLTVITRNYISKSGQVGYVDSRFVSFEIKAKKK